VVAAYPIVPFGLWEEDFLNFAMAQFEHRMARIEKARQQTIEQVYRGEELEDAAV